MTLLSKAIEQSKSPAVQIIHPGQTPRIELLQRPILPQAANGLSARIRRHMAAKGYGTRPPALIASGARS